MQNCSTAVCAVLPELDADAGLGLAWPPWEAPGTEERARDAGTLKTLGEAGLINRESAVRMVAAEYGLADAAAELRRIAGEQGGVVQAQAAVQGQARMQAQSFTEGLARLGAKAGKP